MKNDIINKNLSILAKDEEISLKEMKDALTDYTNSIVSMTEGVASNNWHLLLMGEPGSGKTQTVVDTLDKLIPNQWAGIKGTSSGVGIYRFLYENRNKKVVVIDDSDAIYNTPEAVEILKAAMDTKKDRKISWMKQNVNLNTIGIPNSFEVNCHIILITNSNLEHSGDGRVLKSQRLMKPILDRVMKLKTGLPNREWELCYMKQLHDAGKILCFDEHSIPETVQNEMLDFIEEKGEYFDNISFRTLVKMCKFYINDKNTWKNLTLLTIA